MLKKILLIVAIVLVVLAVVVGGLYLKILKRVNNTDPTYWEKDINEIELRYTELEDLDIVFIGSSSIRKWTTLEEDFEGYKVANHGFGGSKIADSIYYFNRLVTPFNPEAIVLYSGTNDIHGKNKNSASAEYVLEKVKEFYSKVQEELPGVQVYYISISPTVSRWNVWDEANRANALIAEFADENDNFVMIDTTEELLIDGLPNENLLQKDGLHLNEDGYKVWTSIIFPIVTE